MWPACVGNGMPPVGAAIGERCPFVGPIGGVDRRALDHDRAASTTGTPLVVRHLAVGESAVVIAEVGDVRVVVGEDFGGVPVDLGVPGEFGVDAGEF